MGRMCFGGRGLPQDYEEAAKFWRLAAAQAGGVLRTNTRPTFHRRPESARQSEKYLEAESRVSMSNTWNFKLSDAPISGRVLVLNDPPARAWPRRSISWGSCTSRARQGAVQMKQSDSYRTCPHAVPCRTLSQVARSLRLGSSIQRRSSACSQ
jgi:hypothetical protein